MSNRFQNFLKLFQSLYDNFISSYYHCSITEPRKKKSHTRYHPIFRGLFTNERKKYFRSDSHVCCWAHPSENSRGKPKFNNKNAPNNEHSNYVMRNATVFLSVVVNMSNNVLQRKDITACLIHRGMIRLNEISFDVCNRKNWIVQTRNHIIND